MSDATRSYQVGGDHYLGMGVQPWDAMRAWLTADQYEGFLLATTIKHLSRYNAQVAGKGGMTDLRKAQHYLARLVEFEEQRT
jgi:hypothetical protein